VFAGNVGVGSATTNDMVATHAANAIALSPDHIIVMMGLNDHASGISAAQTRANYASYFAAIKASFPNCKFHVVSNMFLLGENWPDGVNTNDPFTVAANTAIQAAVAAEPNAEYLDIRTKMFATDEVAQNSGHATSGILTQEGTHPTKVAGQRVWSDRIFEKLSFGV
jgi:lysophospholipase L1-like esterase